MTSSSAPANTRIGIAIVEHQGNVLVGVRDRNVVLAGMHEFPGGKCLPGESPAECALRECYEETGVRVDVVELLNHTHHVYSHGAVDLYFHLCRPCDGDRLELRGNFQWVPLQELDRMNFPEGNRDVIAKLLHRGAM